MRLGSPSGGMRSRACASWPYGRASTTFTRAVEVSNNAVRTKGKVAVTSNGNGIVELVYGVPDKILARRAKTPPEAEGRDRDASPEQTAPKLVGHPAMV
jgi:hypothetical protein